MDLSALINTLPTSLRAQLNNADLVPVDVGVSGALVVAVQRDSQVTSYVKLRANDSPTPPLEAEYQRLAWLGGRVPVPNILEYGTDLHSEWLVTEALPGYNGVSAEIAGDAEGLVRRFGEALAIFHSVLSVDDCPFDSRTETLLAKARTRVEANEVDIDEFQPVNANISPTDLLQYLESAQPENQDLAVAHGDFSMPNVIFNQPHPPAYLDLGLCGVADRYLDLAIGARSVARNMGGAAVGLFFEGYGIEWPDLPRLDFFVNLQDLL